MEIKEEQFVFLFSEDVRIRHRHRKIKNKILEFTIQMEIFVENKWHPAVRYDTAHGFAHKDIILPSGKTTKVHLNFDNFNEALIHAEEELKAEWKIFYTNFFKEAGNGY